jgi:tetratricopeptide (TPR) repeat protein
MPARILPRFDSARRFNGEVWPAARSVFAATEDGERLFLCDSFGHRIICANPAGKILWSAGTRGDGRGQFHYPRGILWFQDHLLVCDAWNHRIQALDRDGRFLDPFVDLSPLQLYEPSDIIHDESVFFVADRRRRQVVVLDQAGRIARFLGGAAAEGDTPAETIPDLLRRSCLRETKSSVALWGNAHTLGRDGDGHIWAADTQHFSRFDLLRGRHTTLNLPHLLNTRAVAVLGGTAICFDDRSGDLVLLSLHHRRFCHISAGPEPWVAVLAGGGEDIELIRTGSRIACSRRELESIIEEHGAPVESTDDAESAPAKRKTNETSAEPDRTIDEARSLARRVRAASGDLRNQPVCYSRIYAQQHAAVTLPPDVTLICAGRDWLDESATSIAVEVADLLDEAGRLCCRIEGDQRRPQRASEPDLTEDLTATVVQLQDECSRLIEEGLRECSADERDDFTRNEVAIRFMMSAQLEQAATTLADLCRPGRVRPLVPAFSGWRPLLSGLQGDARERLLDAVERFWLSQTAVSEAPREAARRRELAWAWWQFHHLRLTLLLTDGDTLPPTPPRPDRSLLSWLEESGPLTGYETIRRLGSAQSGRTTPIFRGFLQFADALRRARGGEEVAEEVRNIVVKARRKDLRHETEALLYLWPRLPPGTSDWFPASRTNNANLSLLSRESVAQAWSLQDEGTIADDCSLAAIPAAIAISLERDDMRTARTLSGRRMVIAPDLHSCCEHVHILRRCGEVHAADELARELEEREEVRLSAGQLLRQMAHWTDNAAAIQRQLSRARACGSVSPELQAKYLAVLQQCGGAPEIHALAREADSGLYPTPTGLQILSSALVALGKHDMGRSVLDDLINRFGPNGDRFMIRLHNALLCGNREEAERTIADCERLLPDDAVLPFLRAYLAYDGGDAEETAAKLALIPTDSPYAFYGLMLGARSQARQMRLAEALHDLDRAAAFQPRNAETIAVSALMYLDSGDSEAVIRFLGAARLSHVHHPLLSGVRGCLAAHSGKPLLARRHLHFAFCGLPRHYLLPRFLCAWFKSLTDAPAGDDDRQFLSWMRSRWGDSGLVDYLEALNGGVVDASDALDRLESVKQNDRIMRVALSTVRALLAERAGRWEFALRESAALTGPGAEIPFDMILLKTRVQFAMGNREAARSTLAPLIDAYGAHPEVRRLAGDIDLM